MLATAPIQKDNVPTNVVNGSVVPSTRSCLGRRWSPAGGFQARPVDRAAVGGGQLLQVLVADRQRVVVRRRCSGSRRRGGCRRARCWLTLAARNGRLRRSARRGHLVARGRRAAGGSRRASCLT